jgi:metal-responsive CopG/Arc/MetJ family transcriptional regulator
MAMQIRASNVGTSIVLPRTLRREVQEIAEKTGESFGEIVRKLLTELVEREKEAA